MIEKQKTEYGIQNSGDKIQDARRKIQDSGVPGAPGLRSAQLGTDSRRAGTVGVFERECVGSEIIGAQKELV